MVIILEGARGVGKTTVAIRLAEYLMCPVYRPWRQSSPDRELPDRSGEVAKMGIEVNTWREDMYTADLLATLRPESLVLDRSLPSGLAYAQMGVKPDPDVEGLTRLWTERMIEADAFLILLQADDETRAERVKTVVAGEPDLIEFNCVRAAALMLPYFRINGMDGPDQIVKTVMTAIRGHISFRATAQVSGGKSAGS